VKLLVSFDCRVLILNKRDFKVFMEAFTDFAEDLGLQGLDAGTVGRFSRTAKFVSPNRFEYSVVQ
jgi:hypothetical protein